MISICWTTHHEPIELIKRSLDAIKNQDYKDIEVIMVNDCSVIPGVYEFLVGYENLDSRFTLVNLEKNVGFFRAKNVGAILAHGEYFIFMDADQIIRGNSALGLLVNSVSADKSIISSTMAVSHDDDLVTYNYYKCIRYFGTVSVEKTMYFFTGGTIFPTSVFNKIGYLHNTNFSDAEWTDRLFGLMLRDGKQSVCLNRSDVYLLDTKDTSVNSNRTGGDDYKTCMHKFLIKYVAPYIKRPLD